MTEGERTGAVPELGRILALLSLKDRLSAARVNKAWRACATSRPVWKTLNISGIKGASDSWLASLCAKHAHVEDLLLKQCNQITGIGLAFALAKLDQLYSFEVDNEYLSDELLRVLLQGSSTLEVFRCHVGSLSPLVLSEVGSRCASLRKLRLGAPKHASSAANGALRSLAACTNLRDLSLIEWKGIASDDLEVLGRACPQLACLNLTKCPIKGAGQFCLPAVTQLTLVMCDVGKVCSSLPAAFPAATDVTLVGEAATGVLGDWPALSRLVLASCNVSDACLMALAPKLAPLRSLTLARKWALPLRSCGKHDAAVSDAGVRAIAEHCHDLVEVHLVDLAVSSKIIADIAAGCPNMEEMSMVGCAITSFPPSSFPSLHSLSVQDCELESAPGLAGVFTPRLRRLALPKKTPSSTICEVAAACPAIQLIRWKCHGLSAHGIRRGGACAHTALSEEEEAVRVLLARNLAAWRSADGRVDASQHAALTQKYGDLNEEHTTLLAAHATLQKKYNALLAANDSLRARHAEIEEQRNSAQRREASLAKLNEKIKSESRLLRESKKRDKQLAEEAAARMQANEKELVTLRRQHEHLKSSHASARAPACAPVLLEVSSTSELVPPAKGEPVVTFRCSRNLNKKQEQDDGEKTEEEDARVAAQRERQQKVHGILVEYRKKLNKLSELIHSCVQPHPSEMYDGHGERKPIPVEKAFLEDLQAVPGYTFTTVAPEDLDFGEGDDFAQRVRGQQGASGASGAGSPSSAAPSAADANGGLKLSKAQKKKRRQKERKRLAALEDTNGEDAVVRQIDDETQATEAALVVLQQRVESVVKVFRASPRVAEEDAEPMRKRLEGLVADYGQQKNEVEKLWRKSEEKNQELINELRTSESLRRALEFKLGVYSSAVDGSIDVASPTSGRRPGDLASSSGQPPPSGAPRDIRASPPGGGLPLPQKVPLEPALLSSYSRKVQRTMDIKSSAAQDGEAAMRLSLGRRAASISEKLGGIVMKGGPGLAAQQRGDSADGLVAPAPQSGGALAGAQDGSVEPHNGGTSAAPQDGGALAGEEEPTPASAAAIAASPSGVNTSDTAAPSAVLSSTDDGTAKTAKDVKADGVAKQHVPAPFPKKKKKKKKFLKPAAT